MEQLEKFLSVLTKSDDMQVQIKGNKTIQFTAEGISYVLDMLANCPWKAADPLIRDIMRQLKQQENVEGGPESS